MTREGQQATSIEEFRMAQEELTASERMLDLGLARIALTRIYFAAFHAARGLLYAEGLEPRTHEGVHHLFNLHFVKTGRFEPATSRLLAKLQKFREAADYSEAFVIDEKGAREELEGARGFVAHVLAVASSPPAK